MLILDKDEDWTKVSDMGLWWALLEGKPQARAELIKRGLLEEEDVD